MKIRIGEEVLTEHIRVLVRLDFKGEPRSSRFFFGGKGREEMAELFREQQVALLRNVPLQGIVIEDFDLSPDIYTMRENKGRKSKDVAYAPVILKLRLQNLDDLLPILLKPEFRKIEFVSPEEVTIHRLDLERLLFRLSQIYQQELAALEQRLFQ
ncbi:Hypothetical protein DEACI_2725 [Acididesulfobacillus acetoxydans]|uniref:Uncharacterized protein n=1 Tax=Acididesulfobacillus acetoxydans TaxID=1561005 RepID=A0A8S0VXM3_9FIRM|nr:hypothetical protein [Acididesulfobacillus acetoxydans]CAA7602053.1 Hypothetical protein DEACI_2725 [Acididesulfobacillus acetoxydans]CEJ08104.1 Hypothetical protein DEACI_2579 [Acididesulfobacillus acetoxydans]